MSNAAKSHHPGVNTLFPEIPQQEQRLFICCLVVVFVGVCDNCCSQPVKTRTVAICCHFQTVLVFPSLNRRS